ncbi:echotoxin-2-like [Watersipora subatra]|uniref:echotoxin-2-like n=1 Tax=Watersipora subatra TaxID=2589382 RepID=UPI00355AE21C
MGIKGLILVMLIMTARDLVDSQSFVPSSASRSVITSGASINPSVEVFRENNEKYEVTAHMTVENFSKWPLFEPFANPEEGELSYPPMNVFPGEKEAMDMHRPLWTTKGTYGSVSWKIDESKKVIVMWYVPYLSILYSNKLAVGIMDTTSHPDSLAKTMYYDSGSFVRRTYSKKGPAIEFCDGIYCIQGNMESSKQPLINISIYSRDQSYLAPSVQAFLNKNSLIG